MERITWHPKARAGAFEVVESEPDNHQHSGKHAFTQDNRFAQAGSELDVCRKTYARVVGFLPFSQVYEPALISVLYEHDCLDQSGQ